MVGSSQDQDGEEGRSGHHREVLHPAGQRLPHQQARVRGDRHHPQQEAAQQDRRVRDAPDEAHPERAGQGNLHQAAGGGARAQRQLRARGFRSGSGDHRGRHRHQGDAQASGFRQPVESPGDPTSRRHELQDPAWSLNTCNISLNKTLGKTSAAVLKSLFLHVNVWPFHAAFFHATQNMSFEFVNVLVGPNDGQFIQKGQRYSCFVSFKCIYFVFS